MLTDIEPITDADVVLDWGLAEAAKPEMQLDSQIVSRVRTKAETKEDRIVITQRISECRAMLLGFFAQHPVRWHKATIQVAEIGQIRVIRYFEVDHGSHIKTIADVAEHLSELYSIPNFRREEMRGFPIFATTHLHAPLCLIEGTHRCRELLREQGGAPNVRVLIGECPRIIEWHQWPL